ncbi:hypothetical protein M409DRAFT_18354 [Zasmidium cellare ATCC 36951]|uniref:Peroxin 20 n=1 Tax=Zasmidium cellare ATCC 36951 TaxID=1080233 RepID=A0A6A6CYJ4_ZASCE|nr:uncharacterized protein M409DRAFT_18354 [Zasmidium cellare ATCC 36951]KAF2171238.1 hypothetical protein M409DRAFT_18354 [Zasmidium cellare ATCC 36951]
MADAMCGPSNPLQQFKQQTDIDRTLQQDRLTSRQNPAQGFRSQHPSNGALDHEFEAFQAGVEPQLLDHVQPFQRPAGFGAPSQAPSWAADFQRLQISPQPMQQPQHFHPGPSTANWTSGFQDYVAQTAPKAQTSSPSPLAFQQRARGYGNFGFQSSLPQQSFAPNMQSKGKEPVVADQFDEAAFAKAFDQAHEDMLGVEETVQGHENVQEDSLEELVEKIEQAAEQGASQMLNESNDDLDQLEDFNPSRIHGGDVEHDPEQLLHEEEQAQERPQEDDDALAATAQELLEKVEHNQSDKFKNSQFLDLMRKLRDREVRVEGDKMVETANASSTSMADDTLNASSTNQNAQRVYYGKPQPVPLPAHTVDTRPPEYETRIPPQEQDHDPGRINPNDGQDVVDLLNQRGAITDDMASPNTSISHMLYGPNGTLS